MKSVFIYGIVDPTAKKVIYVGRSKDPENRRANIMNRAKRGQEGPLFDKVREILDGGWEPLVLVLSEVPAALEGPAEMFWINRLRGWGQPLVNTLRGGGPSNSQALKRLSP